MDPLWTNDPSVLWKDGNWTKIIPNTTTQTRPELINAIARLSIIAGIVFALFFRSFTPIGLAMLGLFASSRISPTPTPTGTTNYPSSGTSTVSSGGNVQRRKSKGKQPHRRSHKSGNKESNAHSAPQYPQYKPGMAPSGPYSPGSASSTGRSGGGPPSWSDMFGSSMSATDPHSGAMGAYVSLANQTQQQEAYFPPGYGVPGEGANTRNMVPPDDVMEFQSGNVTMRTPFPHPGSSNNSGNNNSGPWAQSSPFQAGFPTAFGPAPTAISPSAGSATRDFAAAAANQLVGPEAFQPANGPIGFGAFASDGGFTSGPLTPAVPHATMGSNFPTMTYQPHNLAPMGPPLATNQQCFPPNAENLLGNPEIAENRVARPRLCPASDPRSDSQQFLNQLYEAPGQISTGYQFFPFPVQDIVEARDNFQKFVYQDGQTHFKDKYSGENVGIYNITDQVGPLGF